MNFFKRNIIADLAPLIVPHLVLDLPLIFVIWRNHLWCRGLVPLKAASGKLMLRVSPEIHARALAIAKNFRKKS